MPVFRAGKMIDRIVRVLEQLLARFGEAFEHGIGCQFRFLFLQSLRKAELRSFPYGVFLIGPLPLRTADEGEEG